MPDVLLAPSILSADLARLERAVAAVEEAGADWLHVDVMDGHFVPNLTFGPPVVAAVRRVTKLPVDVHLMIDSPERWVPNYVEAGADGITVHAEATLHPQLALASVRDAGLRAGLAVNPLTPLDVFEDAWPDLGLALIMSVNPGFGGQRFLERSLGRLRRLRAERDAHAPGCVIQVDGGIDATTAPRAAEAGADVLVAGSAVFGAPSPPDALRRLRASLGTGGT